MPVKSFTYMARHLRWILHGPGSHLSGLLSALHFVRLDLGTLIDRVTPNNYFQEHTDDGLEKQSTLGIAETLRWNTFTIVATFECRLPDLKAKSGNLPIQNH